MAVKASFSMTDEQYRGYVVSSLVAIQAKLAVLFDAQTHLLAKAYGSTYEEQKAAMDKSVDAAVAIALEAVELGRGSV